MTSSKSPKTTLSETCCLVGPPRGRVRAIAGLGCNHTSSLAKTLADSASSCRPSDSFVFGRVIILRRVDLRRRIRLLPLHRST